MDEKAKLRQLVDSIIQGQGNRFIKELLRGKDITIGKNKTDFEKHLNGAINEGKLKLVDVEEWLNRVEGWGDQHVYLFRIPTKLIAGLSEKTIYAKAVEGRMKSLWNKSTAMVFDEEDRLASVSFAEDALRLVWQKAAVSWPRVRDKDYKVEDGLDQLEFRAHRKLNDRAITRFEARKTLRLAALFIAQPFETREHDEMLQRAWRAIEAFMDVKELQKGRIDLSRVSMNIDQQVGTGSALVTPKVKVQHSELFVGGASVVFKSHSKEGSYRDEGPLNNLRQALSTEELELFNGGEGAFWFERGAEEGDLKRRLRVQLHRNDNRVRLWGQMDVREVWTILNMLAGYEHSVA